MTDSSDEDPQQGLENFTSDADENLNEDQSQREIPTIDGDSFNKYWFRRNEERNLEENHPERNDPAHSWPIGRFEPHQLGNCKRKWLYRWLNAPQEEQDPHGIFAVGHFIEEEIIEPWLKDFIEPDYEIDNAIHVSIDIDEFSVSEQSLENSNSSPESVIEVDVPDDLGFNQRDDTEPIVDTDTVCLTVAGSTDPAICDAETGEVIALTEVKSTGSIDRVSKPKRMHMMQLHAYMNALGINDGYVIYVDRDGLLDPKVFDVTFDDEVWETVVDWVNETAEYAITGTLPPADPPEGWMCNYCEFSNRCGEGRSNMGGDMGAKEFVPGYTEYPKNMVEDHLEAHPEVSLTPSLAIVYPDLAEVNDVDEWVCPNCTACFEYTETYFDDFKNKKYATPTCPACENALDKTVYLKTHGSIDS